MFTVLRRSLLLCVSILFVSQATGQELNVYFGNLHSHTSYSDGTGTPKQAYEHARDQARMHFLAITEHNHVDAEKGAGSRADGLMIGLDHDLYNGPKSSSLVSTAQRLTEDGRFVALYGQEFSSISSGNHVNVFDLVDVITVPNGRFDLLLSWLANRRDSTGQVPILQLNHPGQNWKKDPNRQREYGADDFGTRAEWIAQMSQRACMIEILNGPAMGKAKGLRSKEVMEDDYQLYLSHGFRVAPTGDQDNHYATWGTLTDSRTGVIAEALTKQALLAAVRARHVYATEDKNLKVIFRVNGRLCGEIVEAPSSGSELKIEYRIDDGDESTVGYRIDVFGGTVGGPPASILTSTAAQGNTPAGQWASIEDVAYSGGKQYVYFRIKQAGGGKQDRAWTAPVWMEPAGTFIASKNSRIYHISEECRAAKSIKPQNRLTGDAAKADGREPHPGCPVR